MSRRARALAFLVLAVGCAALAATIANGYSQSVVRGYGPLRDVVVVSRNLPRGEAIGPTDLASLQLRRIPVRFVSPEALMAPEQALGREPVAVLPVGSYLLASQLRGPQRAGGTHGPQLGRGRRPVEIAVSGGEALLATGRAARGSAVDVVVTTEPQGPGAGRTYVAAGGVPVLSLVQRDPAGPGPTAGWSATLALTRAEALRLIQAESFARSLRLLPRVGP